MLWTVMVAFATLAWGSGTSSPPPPPAPTVDFSALPASATGRGRDHDGKPHPVTARLLVDNTSVAPGSKVRVGIHLTQADGWHTYWKSPGEIGQPTEVKWTVPGGGTATPIAFPIPQRFDSNDELELESFGYDKEVLLASTVEIPAGAPAGDQVLGADVSWLVCFTTCIPGEVHLEVPLTIAAGPGAPTPYRPLFDHYASQYPSTSTDKVDVAYQLSASAVRPNDPFRAAFVLSPKGGAFGPIDPKLAWPTFTPIAASSDWFVDAVEVRPQPDGKIAVLVSATAVEPDPLPTTEQRIGGLVQVKVGDEWVRTEVDGAFAWAPKDAVLVMNTDKLFTSAPPKAAGGPVVEGPAAVENVAPMSVAPVLPSADAASLAAIVLFAFAGGLILNVMPCVLPVLTLKLYGLVEHADITAARRKQVGLAYGAGVVASFWAMAAAIVILRTVFDVDPQWGSQFQYPPYVAALATVVFGFGLSLLGVFEIPVIGAETADRASNREGLAGSFFAGVFATLLATPCSAPFLGTAIAYAFAAPTPILVTIFTVIALGLASPFVLVAFVPTLFRFLPRPGEWMDTFKQVLGLTLIATTVWLVDVLAAQVGSERTVGFLAFLLTVGIGLWVYGRFGGVTATRPRQLVTAGIGAAIAFAGAAYFLDLKVAEAECADDGALATDLSFEEGVPWQPFSEPRVEALAGTTVFIDFTADWCLSCKVNERTVLETSAVRLAMAELGVVPLKADWTRRDEVITTWLKDHGRAGVPMYLVLPADRTKAPILLPELITPGMVVDALKSAGS